MDQTTPPPQPSGSGSGSGSGPSSAGGGAPARFAAAEGALVRVLEAMPAGGWECSSPCDGWTVRDVVTHMIETQREFLSGRGLEVGAAPDLDGDALGAWRSHADLVTRLLADADVPAREFDGFFGRTTLGEAFVQFYVQDMVVHRWDVASAVGVDVPFTEAELDGIEANFESWGDAMYMEGIFERGEDPPAGASRQSRALARMGRRDW